MANCPAKHVILTLLSVSAADAGGSEEVNVLRQNDTVNEHGNLV
jgi:hypothetical protein